MKESYRVEREDRRRNICFELALKLKGGRYDYDLQINKVNKKYRELLDSCLSDEDMMLVERRLFEAI